MPVTAYALAAVDPGDVLAALALLALAVLAWTTSLKRRPWRPCGHCHRGRDYAPLIRRAFRPCSRCQGTGRRLRPGARILHTDRRWPS